MTHDPLCPEANAYSVPSDPEQRHWSCHCDLIREVRADEREKAARRVTEFFWPNGGSWMSANTTFDRLGRGAVQALRGES